MVAALGQTIAKGFKFAKMQQTLETGASCKRGTELVQKIWSLSIERRQTIKQLRELVEDDPELEELLRKQEAYLGMTGVCFPKREEKKRKREEALPIEPSQVGADPNLQPPPGQRIVPPAEQAPPPTGQSLIPAARRANKKKREKERQKLAAMKEELKKLKGPEDGDKKGDGQGPVSAAGEGQEQPGAESVA